MMQFPYQAEPVAKSAPPSLPKGTRFRFRPLLKIRLIAANRKWAGYRQAVADTGSLDTLFSGPTATWYGVPLLTGTQHSLNWHGAQYPIRFASIELELSTRVEVYRWPAAVGFTTAPIPYPLLGLTGFFEFFDVTFRGADNHLEIAPARNFPGTVKPIP
jgi:hypothetical protein